jgi:hypothetical protein
MKIILASLIASATAFAVVLRQQVKTALNFKLTEGSYPDAQPPLGVFDSLGLLSDAGQEKFDRLRYVEIKHVRICLWPFSAKS